MSITVTYSSADGGSSGQTTLSIGKPTGLANGDDSVLYCGSDGAESTDQWESDPDSDGWTKQFEDRGGSNPRCDHACWYKPADGSEPATLTVDHTASDELWGFWFRLQGSDMSSGFDAVGAAKGSGSNQSSHAATEVTTVAANCIVLSLFSFDGGDGGTFTIDAGTWDAGPHQENAGTGSNDASGAIAWKEVATAGGDNAMTWGTDVSDGSWIRHVSIAPAAGTPVSSDAEVAETAWEAVEATTANQAAVSSDAEVAETAWEAVEATTAVGATISSDAEVAETAWEAVEATTAAAAVSSDAEVAETAWEGVEATTATVAPASSDAEVAETAWEGVEATSAVQAAVSSDAEVAETVWEAVEATTAAPAAGPAVSDAEVAEVAWEAVEATGATVAPAFSDAEIAEVVWEAVEVLGATVAPVSSDAEVAEVAWEALEATTAVQASVSSDADVAEVVWEAVEAEGFAFAGVVDEGATWLELGWPRGLELGIETHLEVGRVRTTAVEVEVRTGLEVGSVRTEALRLTIPRED